MSHDPRRYAPAAERNRQPILRVLRDRLAARGFFLEIASGTGEHVVHFAASMPDVTFQPSDPDPECRASIDGWARSAGAPNVLKALDLDVRSTEWPVAEADVVLCINMIHIAPWTATLGLCRGAGRTLVTGGWLVLYGPFREAGRHIAPSNEAFDLDLRDRNADWGVRDLEAVASIAARHGFSAPDVVRMPANNICVLFRKTGQRPAETAPD